jgi:perosamine synthetase
MKKNSLTRREFLEKTTASVAVAAAVPVRAAMPNNANTLAVRGGTPVRTKPFPSWPQTDRTDEEDILKSLRNHRWCTFDGEFIPKFEKAWAEKVGARGCVMTPCGTHALHTALNVLDVGPGDEVIVAPFTYIATVDVILMCYALPVFADTDPKTFQIDPDDIEHRITEHTRAILPVHISGAPAHLDKILAIAKRHNLPVIEDACQAHTAEWRGKRAGTLGTIGCFSFQESKVLPGGEAGALVSDNEDLLAKAYCFRDFGRAPKRPTADPYVMRGTKYRISDFAAAVLMAQLTRFDEICLVREKNAAYLREEIKKVPGIFPQEHYPESTRQTYLDFTLRYDKTYFNHVPCGKLIEALNAEGIPVGGEYPPLNGGAYLENTLSSRAYRAVFSEQRLARYREQNRCPHNDEICATTLGLAQSALIGPREDMDDVVEAFAKVQKSAAKL